jgi:hypothetical protein
METRQARTKVVVSLLALVGLLGLSPLAMAEDPVYFPDANLKAAVESALGISDPTPTNMLFLTSLWAPGAPGRGIVDLTGIQYATNLRELYLPENQISDISPLSGLTKLWLLALHANQISDISSISGLTNLTDLHLVYNQINDISPLSGLTSLTALDLSLNQINDISPLSGLTNLTLLLLSLNQINDISALSGMTKLRALLLDENPLNVCAYCFYLPLIEAKNRGIDLRYDPNPYPPEACDLYPCCGDGIIQWREGETCEPPDSHIFGSWYCDTECQAYSEPGYCGDGIVQWRRGERCELEVGNECGPLGECIECQCVKVE